MDMLALFFTSLTDLHTLPKSAKRADDSRSTHQWETDKGQQSLPRSLSVVQMPIDYSEVRKKKKKIADSANRRRQSTRHTVTQANCFDGDDDGSMHADEPYKAQGKHRVLSGAGRQ